MSSIKTYGKMLGFLKPYILLFIAATVLSLCVVSLDSISLWFLTSLPQVLFKPDHTLTTSVAPEFSIQNINTFLKYWSFKALNFNPKVHPLAMICIFAAVTFTLKNAFAYLSGLLFTFVNACVSQDMRNILYGHILRLPVSFFDRTKTGNVISLLIYDLNQINASITGTIKNLVMEPIRLILFISLMLAINWKLTLMVFVIYPLLILMIVTVGKSVRRRVNRELESYGGMISVLSETIQNIRAVKMFGMDTVEFLRFKGENNNYRRKALKSTITRDVLGPMTEILAIYMAVILLWYGGKQALTPGSAFTGEDFFRFLILLFSSYQPWKSLAGVNNNIQTGVAAAKRVFGLLDLKPEAITATNVVIPTFGKEITFDNVRFTYPETNTEVLHGISLKAKKGQIVAIVGSSGAGKSTILDLLPRFYDVTQGTIAIDGQDIQEDDLAGLRALFGIVSQETILFDDTIKANIAYGKPDASDDEIHQTAIAANAAEFIERMPNKFETIIGERGVMLSGGQRQRLAIARALLRNPQILILDEATSALDTESERLVQEAINHLVANRTCFVVAHRLSTIMHADTIVVLEKGQIVECGTHGDLLEKGQRYKYFYDIQFGKSTT